VDQGSIQELVCGVNIREHPIALVNWVCRSSILSVDMILPWLGTIDIKTKTFQGQCYIPVPFVVDGTNAPSMSYSYIP
jgi:hypothetical protein